MGERDSFKYQLIAGQKVIHQGHTNKRIEGYIKEAKRQFPFIPTDQLISMVILHFDIPDKIAREKVEEILDKRVK